MDTPIAPSKETPLNWQAIYIAIGMQVAGVPALLAFQNTLLLQYLRHGGVSDSEVMMYLSIPLFIGPFFAFPAAIWVNRIGFKRIGWIGFGINFLGFILIPIAGVLPSSLFKITAIAGIVLTLVGQVIGGVAWFPLLSGFVSESIRGRFFGWLRIAWQLSGFIASILTALFFSWFPSDPSIKTTPWNYLIVFTCLSVGLLLRMLAFTGLPDIKPKVTASKSGAQSLWDLLTNQSFMSFCAYLFLLSTAVTCAPILFALIEKETLQMGEDKLIWLANALMIGSMGGYIIGGFVVDWIGTKWVFLTCHFTLALILFLFPLRALFAPESTSIFIYLIGIHAAFGLTWAAVGIAITSEMFALMPEDNKALSATIINCLRGIGMGLSGAIPSILIQSGALQSEWSLWGMKLSHYEFILIGCGCATLILVVTLGLIPSVVCRKARWMPRSS